MCMLSSATATIFMFFFFNDTATTEIYTLSLHDALPILPGSKPATSSQPRSNEQDPQDTAKANTVPMPTHTTAKPARRSEEHTSELQSRQYLVCRLLLEKKKKHQSRGFIIVFINHRHTIS